MLRLRTIAIGCFVSALAASAQATVVTYDINTAYNGPVSQGTAPFVRVEFDDVIAAPAVRMTATALGLNASEWVARLNINLDPAFDPSTLSFQNFQIVSGPMLQPVIFHQSNQFDAGGGGMFDVEFQFAVSGGGFNRRFVLGKQFTYDITGISGLNANSFNFLADQPGPNGSQLMAALIQGIGANADEGWHAVPEPSGALLALLTCAITSARHRRR